MDLNEENEKQNKIIREVISYLLNSEYNDVEKFHKKSISIAGCISYKLNLSDSFVL